MRMRSGREQVRSDASLKNQREMGDQEVSSYKWKEGVLYHMLEDLNGEMLERLVVPERMRRQILSVDHDNRLSGHFSHRKTVESLKHHFAWPGLRNAVKRWCDTCPKCQKAARSQCMRAPLQPTPVITKPFSRIAFDLVDPLPRTKKGNRSILSSMCLAMQQVC